MRVFTRRPHGSTLTLAVGLAALCATVVAALALPSIARPETAQQTMPLNGFPQTASMTGQTSGRLPRSKLTLRSALAVDLTQDTVTLPLHEGISQGEPVWYILTDVSDAALARTLGLNYAPRLANIGAGCPSCVQSVASSSAMLGQGAVTFQGAPDFRPARILIPGAGASGWPPRVFQPGAMGGPFYSPFVRIGGLGPVYDAPIVAVGAGPFDVVHHTNTHDRVLALDPQKMTVTLLLSHGFASGQPIIFLSLESSDALTATLERSVFVPGLSRAPYPNGTIPLTADLEQGSYLPQVHLPTPTPDTSSANAVALATAAAHSARSEIFVFENGSAGSQRAPGQGWERLMRVGDITQDVGPQSAAMLAALRAGNEAQDVFSFFPTLSDPTYAQDYSPLGDVNFGVWSEDARAHGIARTQTDAIAIEELASDSLITSPGGAALASSGAALNCPAVGYTGEAPTIP